MNILILSRNQALYSTRRLLEESKKAKHNAAVVDYMHCSLICEKQNPVVQYNGRSLAYIDMIIPRIGASFTYHGSSLIRQFEMQNTATLMTSEALLRARDKLHCLQALTTQGVGMPKTYFSYYFYNIDAMITAVGGFPLVIKQLEGAQGYGVFLVHDRKQAHELIQAHQDSNQHFILQEYIAESQGSDIRAFVVGNRVVAAMKRQAQQGEFRSNLHQGGTAHPVELNDAETETAIKSAKTMGLSVAGVDMLQSSRGPLVLEVNASPGLEGIEKTSHVNVAKKIIQFMEHKL